MATAQHFEEDDGESPDIGTLFDLLAAGLFRRHISSGADDDAHLRGLHG